MTKQSVPVMFVANALGKDPSWVRAGIISGYLPIGKATRKGKEVTSVDEMDSRYGRINYYISPVLLYEQTGIKWGEKLNEDTDYKLLELKYFCLQYPEWERRLDQLNYGSRISIDPVIFSRSNKPSDPTSIVAVAKTYYNSRISIIQKCCMAASVDYQSFILESVTKGYDYDDLADLHGPLPFGREEFCRLKGRFFSNLRRER